MANTTGKAAVFWREALEAWAIPSEIVEAAPESPYGFPIEAAARNVEERIKNATPSRRRALEALPEDGTVIDVGCGAGAASLPLAPRAARIIGVDRNPAMLDAFSANAGRLGVEHLAMEGRWLEVSPGAERTDVVVCHHVFYDVVDLEPFVAALSLHARGRVVVEITAQHPWAWMNPLWIILHGVERPTRPIADDAVAVIEQMGWRVQIERWETLFDWPTDRAEFVKHLRKRLCLAPDRDGDIEDALNRIPIPSARGLVTIWWETSESGPERKER